MFHHPYCSQTAGNVDVENPAPGIIFREPAAQHRSQHGREHHAQHIGRHRRAAFLGRKTFQQNRLRNRLQRATARPLHNGSKDQKGEIRRGTAGKRRQRENADAHQKKALAPKLGGKPRRCRQDDGVRDEITRLNPRRLRHRGREIAGDRVQRDADDRSIEHFDEGRQNHRDRDNPRIDFRLVGFAAHKRKVSGLIEMV